MDLLRAIALTAMAGALQFYKAVIVLLVVWGAFVTLPGLSLLVGQYGAFYWKCAAVCVLLVWSWKTVNHYLGKIHWDRLEALAEKAPRGNFGGRQLK